MNGKWLIFAGALLLCIGAISCEKTVTQPGPSGLQLSYESLKTQNSIPLEYGNLVGVAVNAPGYARLFFEKPDKTIVVVTVNVDKGSLSDRVLVIPRK
jgi:hypothetical protein